MTTDASLSLADQLKAKFGDSLQSCVEAIGQVTIEIPVERARELFLQLRDDEAFDFAQLMDLCGVDYLGYGKDEWATSETQTHRGYSRAVEPKTPGRSAGDILRFAEDKPAAKRFAVVYHLLSITHNRRLRVRVYAPDDELPVVPTVVDIWSCADWYEREAFDLYGIVFEGHPDLRRILTDYGFVGYPFRKDFPLIGHVEMRYDASKGRVVYEPVSIEPRVLVPRVIRDDHRYEERLNAPQEDAKEKVADA